MRGQLIEVTQQDIDMGLRRSCKFCPVALAVKRQVKKPAMVDNALIRVGHWTNDHGIMTEPFHTEQSYKAPRSVSRFINTFDDYGSNGVKPFKFYLTKA